MTENELRELIQLIKDNELYCRVDLETNETELSEDVLSYSSLAVFVYKDEHCITEVLKFQMILDSDSETYYFENMSYKCDGETTRKANNVVSYCKYLIKKYM